MRGILAAASLSLALLSSPVRAADIGSIWNELFNVEEQRVLFAMMADPEVEGALKGGFSRVLAAQSSADAFAYEKAKLQSEWLGRVADFSSRYQAGDALLQARTAKLPKPSAEAVAKAVPWFAEVDARDWGGALIAASVARMNAHEAGYSLASLRSFTAKQREEMLGQLSMAKTFRLKTGAVAEKLVGATQEKFTDDLSKAGAGAKARAQLAKTRMESLAPALARAVEKPGDAALDGSDSAKDQLERVEQVARRSERLVGSGDLDGAKDLGKTYDGSRTRSDPGLPVDGRAGNGDGETVPGKELAELQPAAKGPSGGLFVNDIPPPQSTNESVSAGGGGALTLLKSPMVGAGLGALIGGVLGFFLGGPIGAAIGAAALGGGAFLFLNQGS